MSNDMFERVFKLWVSLWELVLNNKRHLGAVCTTLQKLVFEFKGYPKFKNWEAICGLQDWCLKMTLARVDTDSDVGHRMQVVFPECFSIEKDRGQIPVSVLMEYSREKGRNDEGVDRSHYLALTETLQHFHVPFLALFIDPDEMNQQFCDASITYDEALAMGFKKGIDDSFGRIVTYQGQDYFVAEVSGDQETYLVPVEALCFRHTHLSL